ncbi:MAG: SusD/RagB family nutrient-binding outer membrane lipoprotein [Prolixibacteraceae bacterium]|nr:SusD/RagB family nutrient-binding outer membrane lipoprotein [Prolixibacteraceae bacterium]
MKKIIILLLAAFFMNGCTDKFEEANKNPYQFSDESLQQDFNHIGSYYPSLLSDVMGLTNWKVQVSENLVSDSYADYLASPTPFAGGMNNTTYRITWKSFYWDQVYQFVMAPANQVIKIADAGKYDVFSSWAKLIRILGVSRLTTYHGPVIYSNYGSATQAGKYDSEPELYNKFFSELDEIQSVFAANKTYAGITRFDASYNGDVTKWAKLVNSMRLRLAIRISKVNPALAKAQGEKAISDPAGLIMSNDDNFNISNYGQTLALADVCFDWGDTRMSAGMESILVGLKDARITKFFQPATDNTLYSDHPSFPYKGIRNGALLVSKDDHTSFSMLNESFKTMKSRNYLAASEVYFNLAEAALRGWAGAGNAELNYENGVRLSFANWGASGVDAYLADSTSKPIDYNDPKSNGSVNDFISRSTVTVKWSESDSNELKLEKIITQKWIAGFFNSNEAWVDFRRTGYPQLATVYKNDSNADNGIVPVDQWIKRLPFVDAERTGNAAGIIDATSKLGGPDLITTRLWWDTGNANF